MPYVHMKQRDIRCGIGADNLRWHFPGVRQAHTHGFRTGDDVIVRHDETVRSDDESRTQHALAFTDVRACTRSGKKAPQYRAYRVSFAIGSRHCPVRGVLRGALASLFNKDGHDAGRDASYKVCVTGLSRTAQ